MTITDVVSSLMRKPIMANNKLPTTEKRELLKAETLKGVSRLSALYDFPFNRGLSTFTTEASVTDYTLKGSKSDCREVKYMKYGSNSTPLKKYREADYNRGFGNQPVPTAIAGWYPAGEAEGYPVVSLIGTVGAGTEITYGYRKRNMTVEDWPEEWMYVLDDLVLSLVHPNNRNLTAKADKSYGEMIESYERDSGEESPIVQSSEWRNKNIRRNNKYGY